MDIRETVIRIIEPVLKSYNVDLVDVEYQRERSRWVLRIYLDKNGGITLNDCTEISREIGELIDINDLIDHSYTLEVSSPGLNRPLKSEKDFARNIGKLVRIKTKEALEGQKNFIGELLHIGVDTITLKIDKKEKVIPLALIQKARLEPQIFERLASQDRLKNIKKFKLEEVKK